MEKAEFDFKKIDEARKILGLCEKATIKEIKDAYKEKAKAYHPDLNENKKEYHDIMKKINEAYKILMDYCENYPLPLKKGKIEEKNLNFESDWLLSKRIKE